MAGSALAEGAKRTAAFLRGSGAKGRRLTAVLAGLAILTVGGALLWGAQREPASAGGVAGLPPPLVHVAAAVRRDLPIYVRGIGHVQPSNVVQVSSRIDGQIDRILFTEGQQVQAGDALIAIDPRAYQAAVAQAEGALAKDRAQLIAAEADLKRASTLMRDGYVSRQLFDRDSAAVGQLTAALKVDQAALDEARLNLQFATIRAPISGRIGKRLVDAGNIVHTADDKVLAEIVQLRPVYVLFTVPQDALPDLQAGQRRGVLAVQARSDDDQTQLDEGRLTLIGNQIDPQTGTIELKALFDNAGEALWPGQFVNVRVVIGLRKDVVAVPLTALQTGIQGKLVYLLGAKSTVSPRAVRMLQAVHGEAVVDGLKPGEIVVTDNVDRLAPGMAVAAQRVSSETIAAGPRAEGAPR